MLHLLLAAIFLAHGIEDPHTREDRLKALDMQIERLEKIADQYQDKANEQELAAQPLALRDWSAYAKAMEEAEKSAGLAMQTRKKIDELKKAREQLDKKPKES